MSFDATKSTKGASKLRRDLINAEIANLRDLLPLPSSTRQRLSQLQLMALVCVYVRKANYFHQVFRKYDSPSSITPNVGFSKALSGFLMMCTQNGKLLYISDNAAEYLGHSMEDLLIHGDSVYDIIDKQDHQAVQSELMRSSSVPGDDERLFLCRMNVSRNARRQMRFGDQKVVLVRGHFVSFLPLCSRNEPVFLALCTPVAMPETRECVVQGATQVFTSIHSMDMKFIHLDKNGEFYLGYTKGNIQGLSWYQLVHWEHMREAQSKHKLITQSEQEKSGILLLRLHTRTGGTLWIHAVLQVKDNLDNTQQPVVVCTNQVLSEKEARVMRANASLYHYYSVQSKLQYGLTYPEPHIQQPRVPSFYPPSMGTFITPEQPPTSASSSSVAAAAYFPPVHGPPNGSQPPPHYGFPPPGAYHPHSLALGGGSGGVAAAMAVPAFSFALPAAPKRLFAWKSGLMDEDNESDDASLVAMTADCAQTVPDVSMSCSWGSRASVLTSNMHELREQHVPDIGGVCRTPSPTDATTCVLTVSPRVELPLSDGAWRTRRGAANSSPVDAMW